MGGDFLCLIWDTVLFSNEVKASNFLILQALLLLGFEVEEAVKVIVIFLFTGLSNDDFDWKFQS